MSQEEMSRVEVFKTMVEEAGDSITNDELEHLILVLNNELIKRGRNKKPYATLRFPENMTITMCGSTKFKKQFEQWIRQLTARNNLVFSMACFHHADKLELSDEELDVFVRMHRLKIDNSDAVFVIDVGHYLGQTTMEEIAYARQHNKHVYYLSDFK